MKMFLFILVVYALILILAYFFQEKLIFIPEKLNQNHHFDGGKELFLKTRDGVTLNALLYEKSSNHTIVIYFHGNAGSLAGWQLVSDKLLPLGLNLLIFDYRGYGKSNGTFSEKGFYEDAETIYDYAKKLGYHDNQIIFYGRSLGTGIAVEMALRHPVKAVILESPYTSFLTLARKSHWYLLPDLLLKYRFDNVSKISQLRMPVLLLHGEGDELVPLSHSKVLNEKIKTQHTLMLFPTGKHNGLDSFPLYHQTIQNFLKSF